MSLSIRRVRSTHREVQVGIKLLTHNTHFASSQGSGEHCRVKPGSLTGKSHQYWHASYRCLCLLKQNREMWREGKEPWPSLFAELQTTAGCTVQSRRTHLDTPVVLLLEKHSTKSCALARNAPTCVCPAPHGGGRHRANVQEPAEAQTGRGGGMTTKFTPRFYLLYHSSSNAAFLHVILGKDLLHLVTFPKSFPLFSMLHGSHSRGHCKAPDSPTANSPLTFMKGRLVFSGNKQKSVPGTKF